MEKTNSLRKPEKEECNIKNQSGTLPQAPCSVSEYLEDVIEKCGGFGRYQFLLTILLLSITISVTWTMLMMSFGAAKPDWWCVTYDVSGYGNQTKSHLECAIGNKTECDFFRYDTKMITVVSQWDLLCESSWVTSTITTIQMSGVLVGGLLCGQMGDYFGRKPTLFSAIFLITVTNVAAVFSVSWQMFAVLRFFMGISCGMILTTYFVLLFEFIAVTKRAIIGGIPSWTIFAALFALLSWWLHDWRYLHVATAVSSGPLLLTWWIVPESFRWLVAHKRFDEARVVIKKMARFNGAPEPELTDLEKLRETESAAMVYTFLDIFKGRNLLKSTIILATMWLSCGYVYYAISFSVQSLSGSLYLNMFLLSAVEIPANSLTICLNNRLGRKWTALLFFILCSIASLGVAVVQVFDVGSFGDQLINGFALVSKLGCAAGWVSVSVLTTEVYPTVVRNIGYGFHNTMARVGAMIAPQMIFLDDSVPGMLYFLCCGLMIISAVCAVMCRETRDAKLSDILQNHQQHHLSLHQKHPKGNSTEANYQYSSHM